MSKRQITDTGVTRKHYSSMGHLYKWLGSDEEAKKLWQNKEALEMYIARLKEYWDEENQCWLESPKTTDQDAHSRN